MFGFGWVFFKVRHYDDRFWEKGSRFGRFEFRLMLNFGRTMFNVLGLSEDIRFLGDAPKFGRFESVQI